jgi:hypothetical protein
MSASDTLKRLYSEVARMIRIAGNAGIYGVGEDPSIPDTVATPAA